MKARTQGRRGELGIGRLEVLQVVLIAGLLGSLGCASLRRGHRRRIDPGARIISRGSERDSLCGFTIRRISSRGRFLSRREDARDLNRSPIIFSVCPTTSRRRQSWPVQVLLGTARPRINGICCLINTSPTRALNCHNRLVMNEPSRAPWSALSLIALDMDLEGVKPVKCSSCSGNVMEFTVGPGAPLRWSMINHVDVGKLMRVDGTVAAVASWQPSRPNSSKDEWRQSLHIMIPR